MSGLAIASAAAWDGVSGRVFAQQQAKPQAAAAGRSQWSGIYTVAQAKRGESLYTENCSICHGAALEGTDSAPPLTGDTLATRWNNKPLSDLFEVQQMTMPWLSPGGFSRGKNADILAYLLQKGSFPAGTTELPAQADAQRQITILAKKP